MLALVASCAEGSSVDEHTCTGASAISAAGMRGWSLPPKTLALTFDDGPGARTSELSSWLAARGIRAAFFVNGFHVWNPPVLDQIAADGHLLANHTQDHKSLTGRATNQPRLTDWQVQNELTQTDDLIAGKVDHDRFLFRPPYGDWDATSYAQVSSTPMQKYVGPVLWNIGDHMTAASAADWDCWQPGTDGKVYTVQQCGDLYAKEIDAVGHGIVLMHDFYFIDNDPSHGGTVDMIEYLVPTLVAKGYTFVRVDEVPEIAALLPPLPKAADGSDDGASPSSSAASANPEATAASSSAPTRSASSDPAATRGDGSTASGDNREPCPPSPHDPP